MLKKTQSSAAQPFQPAWPAELPSFIHTIGVTGGIGSGKSHVCQLLEQHGKPVFYTDAVARQLLHTSPELRQALMALVGSTVYHADGSLNKAQLRAYLQQGKAYSAQVDALVHPLVAQAWCDFVTHHRQRTPIFPPAQAPSTPTATPYIYMECALLFETHFDQLVAETLLVSCPDDIRIKRVMARDGVDRATAQRWLTLQMPEAEKLQRAHHQLLNDGVAPVLAQLQSLGLLP